MGVDVTGADSLSCLWASRRVELGPSIQWSEEHDVLVAGSGGGGVTGAYTAAREGLDVLLVEATDSSAAPPRIPAGAGLVPLQSRAGPRRHRRHHRGRAHLLPRRRRRPHTARTAGNFRPGRRAPGRIPGAGSGHQIRAVAVARLLRQGAQGAAGRPAPHRGEAVEGGRRTRTARRDPRAAGHRPARRRNASRLLPRGPRADRAVPQGHRAVPERVAAARHRAGRAGGGRRRRGRGDRRDRGQAPRDPHPPGCAAGRRRFRRQRRVAPRIRGARRGARHHGRPGKSWPGAAGRHRRGRGHRPAGSGMVVAGHDPSRRPLRVRAVVHRRHLRQPERRPVRQRVRGPTTGPAARSSPSCRTAQSRCRTG